MIRFSCRCGHVFQTPDDSAGTELQCPNCHLLNDVPFLSDLEAITGDGTYKLDAAPPRKKPEALGHHRDILGSGDVDESGQPLDLRGLSGDEDDIGEYDTIATTAKRQRPRYDPETGELVKPIPLSKNRGAAEAIDPSAIPFATRGIDYARIGAERSRLGIVLLDLCQPINIVVMAFVFGFHLLIYFFTIAIAMNFLLVVPIYLALIGILIAHYGNVVDDIGLRESNEIPRVMRDLQMSEDIWHPLLCVLGTAAFCYGPAITFALHSQRSAGVTAAIAMTLAIAGTVFLPAILLTSLTSGSAANLRPDRILGLIRLAGARYIGLIIAFAIAAVTYFWGFAAFTIQAFKAWTGHHPNIPAWTTMWPVAMPVMCMGIFAMHFFCWELGLLHRMKASAFPWVNQYHVQAPRPPVRRRKPKYFQTVPPGE